MSYADDLKYPLWQQCRLRVFERAGWRCQRCGGQSKQLHAHHKTYIRGRKPWEYDPALLECLCDPCHLTAHELKERLEIMVAEHPTSELPQLAKLFGLLGSVLRSDQPAARADAANALQDELDALEDYRRGPGANEAASGCLCSVLCAQKSAEKWSDETFYENGHVCGCPLGDRMEEVGL